LREQWRSSSRRSLAHRKKREKREKRETREKRERRRAKLMSRKPAGIPNDVTTSHAY
jgi:hypothetical protein